ncbi:MAG: hypothetical protein ACQ9MH_05905 [Nitrospinales bacterium]
MEESSNQPVPQDFRERFLLKFSAANGFIVVLEFLGMKDLESFEARIKGAGLKCERLEKFNVKFDKADLLMDMRSAVCIAQFDLEDWI